MSRVKLLLLFTIIFSINFSPLSAQQEYAFANEFNTNGDVESWTANNHIGGLIQATSINGVDGVLTGQSPVTGMDPQFVLSMNIPLDMEKYGSWDTITIRMRQIDPINLVSTPWSDDGTLGLFAPGNYNLKPIGLGTDDPWEIEQQDDNWIVAKADISIMGPNAFSRIRIDPIGNAGSTGKNIEIDYLRITGKPPEPEEPTWLDSITMNGDSKNVVFILIDDMGWADLGCYGSDLYETPEIDKFAQTGMLFTDAYAASPLCSPTRASILTGLEPGRLRFTTPSGHVEQVVLNPQETSTAHTHNKASIPQTATRLSNSYITFAEMFKALGYSTAFMGKWHLGREPYIPENQGFDVVVGGREHPGPPGPGYYFAPWNTDTLPLVPTGTHICDVVTDEAIDYITEKKEDPFMLCLWYYDVHAPFQSKDNLTEKYANKIDDNHIQRSALMGGMVDNLDSNIGRFLDKMSELGLDENTIVILTSDNGGNMYDSPEGQVATNNYPLRAGKGNNYEGGVRVPLIVRAPGVTAPNTTSPVVTSTVDHYVTMMDLLDIPVPSSLLTDGVSFVPALEGEVYDRPPIFSTFCHRVPRSGAMPNISIRDKEWKLYRFYHDNPDLSHRYELYNLIDDISEANNLATLMPEKVQEMDVVLDAHIEASEILESQVNQNYIGNAAAGWWGSDDTELSIVDNKLHIVSSGADPYVETDFIPSFDGTRFYFTFDVKSSASGAGSIQWTYNRNDAYTSALKSAFEVNHDGMWHSYRVPINVSGNIGLFKITPATGTGVVEIENLKMETVDGYPLREYKLTYHPLTTTLTTASISEAEASDLLQLFPNPSYDEVNVIVGQKSDLRVYTMNGSIVYEASNIADNHSVNVINWASGHYLFSLSNGQGSATKIFVRP